MRRTSIVDDTVRLPRWQVGNTPQHLLTTVLGDFWLGRPEYLPSRALVRILEDLGSSAESARAAVSRLARRGVITAGRTGRRTSYRLTRATALIACDIQQRVVARPKEDWSGRWLLCGFSIPEARRDVRARVRAELRALGFAPLYDGMLVTAADVARDAAAVFRRHKLDTFHLFESADVLTGSRSVAESCWPLEALRQSYRDFDEHWREDLEAVRAGDVSPREAFALAVHSADRLRQLSALDPGLPRAALPSDWPRVATLGRYAEFRDLLAPLAELWFKGAVAEYAPELARHVHVHSLERMAQGREGVASCPDCVDYSEWAEEEAGPS